MTACHALDSRAAKKEALMLLLLYDDSCKLLGLAKGVDANSWPHVSCTKSRSADDSPVPATLMAHVWPAAHVLRWKRGAGPSKRSLPASMPKSQDTEQTDMFPVMLLPAGTMDVLDVLKSSVGVDGSPEHQHNRYSPPAAVNESAQLILGCELELALQMPTVVTA